MRHRRKLHRREKKLRNKKIIISMFALVLFLSCGYAAFQTSINLNAKGTIKNVYTVDDLKGVIVTSGDGLYEDYTEDNRYVYKGAAPNNYIQLGNDIYRIIAIESDNTLKVIKQNAIGYAAFDLGYAREITGVTDANSLQGTRYSSTSTDYCGYTTTDSEYVGCNVWGSKYTMLDSNESNIISMQRSVDDTTTYDLPETEAYINTYLNNTYYNSLDTNLQNIIVSHIFNVGLVKLSVTELNTTMLQEKSYKWRGYIGLINASDYVKASSDIANCNNIYAYTPNVGDYSSCITTNWIRKISSSYIETITPRTGEGNFKLPIHSQGSFTNSIVEEQNSTYPVFYLSSSIKLKGQGTENQPYEILNS